MSRFFVPKSSVNGDNIVVSGDEAHHIIDVMRLKAGDGVVAFDGTGKEYLGVIGSIGHKTLTVKVTNVRSAEAGVRRPKITLIQAVIKKDKMDYIVEKATELGVASIFPVMAERTIPNWDVEKKTAQVERWRKLSREAAKQCGRTELPIINEIRVIDNDLFRTAGVGLKMIAALSDGSVGLKTATKDHKGMEATIAIGPEGDFTPIEISGAREAGFVLVSLGDRVLKSDTAGLAALSIIYHELSS